MLRQKRRDVNFKPNRRIGSSSIGIFSSTTNTGIPQRLTGRQKLALANKKGSIDRLGEMLPQCRTFIRLCKHILNLEERHVNIKGVWRQRRYLSRSSRSDEELRELDAKSSRSVMYENEELRLRTININAEIERGQSDIKKLKKENEQLRREIWTLRDEYDKLEKLLASKVNLDCDEESHDSESCHSNDSDGSCQTCGSCNNTEANNVNDISQHNGTACNSKAKKEKLHVEFDHLSIVSEESQRSPNEDRLAVVNEQTQNKAPESPFPLTEIQSLVPPLTHFENLKYDSIGPGNVDENGYIVSNTKNNEETSKSQQQQQQWTNSSNKPDILLQQSSSTSAQVTPSPSDPSSLSYRNFQTGGNLDELLQDIEFLSKDIEDLQTQNKNKSDTSLNQSKKKPFRSEVSLVLDFPGNNSSSTQIETKPIIHPVPPDESGSNKLPSPPILKDQQQQQRSSIGFEHLHMNGSATMEVRSPTQNIYESERKLSSSESTLAKSSKAAKRVSLSLVGKKANRFKKHDSIEKASHASRRMSLDLDLSPTHAPHPNSHHNDSRRHSCDSNKSHHKKRSRSDSINSRGTYTTEPSSQRRISVTSYQSSKKIPWCGCWGLC